MLALLIHFADTGFVQYSFDTYGKVVPGLVLTFDMNTNTVTEGRF